ncbi:MAG: helix-turn-helix domain-containing protein [Methanoregula sp.]|jgi:DNA-binding HxlR family transcriptional regulator
MPESKIPPKCPVELFCEVMGSKWKILIIWNLKDRKLRFTALQKKMHNVNSKTLTTHLRELEELKIISRVLYPEVPPRVEYSLTGYGKGLFPVFESIRAWGLHYLESEKIPVKKC